MSLVGTRPEAQRYAEHYKPEYMATLLLPAGITSETSIRFLKEEEMLRGAADLDEYYISAILPEKMKSNLSELEKFSIMNDFKTIIHTLKAVRKKTNGHE